MNASFDAARFSAETRAVVEKFHASTADNSAQPSKPANVGAGDGGASREKQSSQPRFLAAVVKMHPNGEIALALVRDGRLVTPLNPDGQEKPKSPFMQNWPNCPYGAHNKKALRARWEEANYNVGLVMGKQPNGRHLVAIDVDVKNDSGGDKSLANLELLGLPTDGVHTITPSGGKHYFFWTDRPLKSPRGIMPGIDIRCEAGQVVAPGSTIHGKPYIKVDGETPELPDWMADIIEEGAKRHHKHEDLTPLVEWDKPENIRQAIDYLENHAPEGTYGNRNNTAFKVGARVKDFGISKNENKALLLEYYFGQKCPDLDTVDELDTTLSSVYRNGQLPAGIADASGELPDVTKELIELAKVVDKQRRRRLHYVSFKTSAEQALEAFGKPLVKGLLDCGAFSVLYADTNQGKTFVMLDIAFHIATGRPWNGRKVKQGLVVYVAAEGGRGIFKRLAALRNHYKVDDIPMVVVPCPINLLDKSKEGDTAELIKLIKDAEREYGMAAELVVIDTLSRALAGGNENGPEDMGTFVSHIDKVRAATDAHLCVVHHTGHGEAKRMRGWSGVPAALDTTLEIAGGVLRNTKQRDREQATSISFKLTPIQIGVDEDGEPVTSAVVVWGKEMADVTAELPLSKQEETMMDALVELANEKTSKHDKTRQTPEPTEVAIKTSEMLEFAPRYDPTLRLADSTLKGICRSLSEKRTIKKGQFGHWVIPSVGKCRKVSEAAAQEVSSVGVSLDTDTTDT